MTSVAIMQPTYLPWSGYFGLMQSVDIFVFLDSVQFAKRSWQQRNQIKTPNGPQWLSVPVHTKGKRDQLICQVEIDKTSGFAETHRRSIEFSYSKTPYFEAYSSNFLPLIGNTSNFLADLTIELITYLQQQLHINTQLVRSSQLAGTGSKADLLASICHQLGATMYVSPPGSKEYLDASDAFTNVGVPVHYFEFDHPEYPQPFGSFVPYMSVVDMLFNCGEKSTSMILDASRVV